MTTNDRTQQLRTEVERLMDAYWGVSGHNRPEKRPMYSEAILALLAAEQQALLDRIAQSVKQHTVPEGIDLVTRSYVLNTLEFERSSLKAELGGEAE